MGETKSYVATLDSPLPQNFSDHSVPNNCSANLQLIVSSDSTAVSLLATWINTTIVIRKHANLLGVTVQVPGHLAFESNGLCRGCPAHAYFNVSRFNDKASEHCESENWSVLFLCFNNFSNKFNSIFNNSYADVCQYSLWRGNTTRYNELSFLVAVSKDAKLLPDRGYVPPRSYEIVSRTSFAVTDDLCHPVRQSNSSETTTEPVDATDTIDTSTYATTSSNFRTTISTTLRVSPDTEKPTVTSTTLGKVDSEISSASHNYQRSSMRRLLLTAIFSAFVIQLLHR